MYLYLFNFNFILTNFYAPPQARNIQQSMGGGNVEELTQSALEVVFGPDFLVPGLKMKSFKKRFPMVLSAIKSMYIYYAVCVTT